jgi:hypothetical protein
MNITRTRSAVAVMFVLQIFLEAGIANGEEIQAVKTSGEQWSGEGKDWSPWYTLGTDPPPPGYYLAAADFRLAGDRACGAWAECRKIADSPYYAAWEFRMQGHDENKQLTRFVVSFNFGENFKLGDSTTWPLPKIDVTLSGTKATSTGVIAAVYKPEPPPTLPQTITWTKTREEWSGHGDAWSSWYTITSEPAPPRYALTGVEFHLTGDRSCGAWAECKETTRDAKTVTWAFRMQGHSESLELVDGVLRGKAATSTGSLATTYTLVDPPASPPPLSAEPTRRVHTVVKGDSLARIAEKIYGSQKWPLLYKANRDKIDNPDLIFPGQELVVP